MIAVLFQAIIIILRFIFHEHPGCNTDSTMIGYSGSEEIFPLTET